MGAREIEGDGLFNELLNIVTRISLGLKLLMEVRLEDFEKRKIELILVRPQAMT